MGRSVAHSVSACLLPTCRSDKATEQINYILRDLELIDVEHQSFLQTVANFCSI